MIESTKVCPVDVTHPDLDDIISSIDMVHQLAGLTCAVGPLFPQVVEGVDMEHLKEWLSGSDDSKDGADAIVLCDADTAAQLDSASRSVVEDLPQILCASSVDNGGEAQLRALSLQRSFHGNAKLALWCASGAQLLCFMISSGLQDHPPAGDEALTIQLLTTRSNTVPSGVVTTFLDNVLHEEFEVLFQISLDAALVTIATTTLTDQTLQYAQYVSETTRLMKEQRSFTAPAGGVLESRPSRPAISSCTLFVVDHMNAPKSYINRVHEIFSHIHHKVITSPELKHQVVTNFGVKGLLFSFQGSRHYYFLMVSTLPQGWNNTGSATVQQQPSFSWIVSTFSQEIKSSTIDVNSQGLSCKERHMRLVTAEDVVVGSDDGLHQPDGQERPLLNAVSPSSLMTDMPRFLKDVTHNQQIVDWVEAAAVTIVGKPRK